MDKDRDKANLQNMDEAMKTLRTGFVQWAKGYQQRQQAFEQQAKNIKEKVARGAKQTKTSLPF